MAQWKIESLPWKSEIEGAWKQDREWSGEKSAENWREKMFLVGILLGVEMKNAFFVDQLLIP